MRKELRGVENREHKFADDDNQSFLKDHQIQKALIIARNKKKLIKQSKPMV